MLLKLEITFKRMDDAPIGKNERPQWLWEATAAAPFPSRMGRGDTVSQALADLLKAVAQEVDRSAK